MAALTAEYSKSRLLWYGPDSCACLGEARLAKKVASQNGQDRLKEAITLLIQNEAALAARLADSDKRQAENERLHLQNERRWLELKQQSDERFARIEKDIGSIIQVLNEHTRTLERLPDALREKIGFKQQ